MKVSVITVTYNRGHLIHETIKSVLAQSCTNFEYLIIDDGSTDHTEQVVNGFHDSRIRYFKQARTANLSTLHNFGVAKSEGDLISILDSDDLWATNKLEKIISIFNLNKEISLVTHNIKYFKEAEVTHENYYPTKKDLQGNLFKEVLLFRILPFPVFTFKKSVLEKLDYMNENYFDGQQDFLFRLAKKHSIYFSADTLSYIRLHTLNTHSTFKNTHYYRNYYKSVFNLFRIKEISSGLFLKSLILISKNFLSRIFDNSGKF
ncbi:MAG: glycosyltransferase [Chitinophagaceae bacterium]|jgi:glycosyltransferase involved in cell wall biosynthesis